LSLCLSGVRIFWRGRTSSHFLCSASIRSVDTRTAPSWLLLPLMTLWANLHGSFTFGLAMIGAAGAETLFRAKPVERMNVIRQWGSFGVLALAAACLNPYGPEMILVTFRTVARSPALATRRATLEPVACPPR
jgi:hypothetical protein